MGEAKPFQIGDRVRWTAADPGVVGTVTGHDPDGVWCTVRFGLGPVDRITCHRDDLVLHGVPFPVPAEHDPWRDTERNARGTELSCLADCPLLQNSGGATAWCDRPKGHPGHHITRDRRGNVVGRWRIEDEGDDDAPCGPTPPSDDRLWQSAESFMKQLARALFELEHDGVATLLIDGDARNDKAAVLERMWTRAPSETRAEYAWRAALVLRRTTDLLNAGQVTP